MNAVAGPRPRGQLTSEGGIDGGIQPSRIQTVGNTSTAVGPAALARLDVALRRDGSFLRSGNSSAFYMNGDDLWIWPKEISNSNGTHPVVTADAASDSGAYFQVVSGAAMNPYESNGTEWKIGSQIPAAKVRVYIKALSETAPSTQTVAVKNFPVTTTYGSATLSWGSTYGVQSFDADLSAVAGGTQILIAFSAPTQNIDVAWIAIVPWRDSSLVNGPSLNTPPVTSFTGSSGAATCSMSMQGTLKITTCELAAYAETGAAQTYTYPTAFTTAPVLLESGGSCGTYNPTTSASVLTLPANAGMSAETCNVVAEGQ